MSDHEATPQNTATAGSFISLATILSTMDCRSTGGCGPLAATPSRSPGSVDVLCPDRKVAGRVPRGTGCSPRFMERSEFCCARTWTGSSSVHSIRSTSWSQSPSVTGSHSSSHCYAYSRDVQRIRLPRPPRWPNRPRCCLVRLWTTTESYTGFPNTSGCSFRMPAISFPGGSPTRATSSPATTRAIRRTVACGRGSTGFGSRGWRRTGGRSA